MHSLEGQGKPRNTVKFVAFLCKIQSTFLCTFYSQNSCNMSVISLSDWKLIFCFEIGGRGDLGTMLPRGLGSLSPTPLSRSKLISGLAMPLILKNLRIDTAATGCWTTSQKNQAVLDKHWLPMRCSCLAFLFSP